MDKMLIVMTALFAAQLHAGQAGCAKTFYLRPGGADGVGTPAAPFGSFDAAKEAVRAAVRDASLPPGRVEVVVLDGTYPVKKTLSFSKEDSGTESHKVVWRAATRGGARLTGGIPLPPLRPLAPDDPNLSRVRPEARANVMVADLKSAGVKNYGVVKASGIGGAFMELVWDGRLQTLARWPNEDYTGIASAEQRGKDANGKKLPARWFVAKDDRVATWADEPEPYGNGFFYYTWAANRVAFASIDRATKRIEQKGSGSRYGYSKSGFWFGFNLLCELDAPGEYYIDRSLGRLYFWPPSRGDAAEAELTRTVDLLSAADVSHIAFDGFAFENCRGVALIARNPLDMQVVGCTFRNIGARAVDLRNAALSRIAGCDIAWCGAGGVAVNGGDPDRLEGARSSVENCHIHHFALSELTYTAAVFVSGCGVTVRNNTIHDGPHGAIRLSGREHDISWNEIHSVLLECGEMGVIYAGRDWTLCGNRITANYIHDIYNPRSQFNRGVMLDDGAAGFTVTSNRFARVPIGVSLSGVGNVVENNLFESNFPPIRACQEWRFHSDYTNASYTHQIMLEKLAALKVHEEPWKSRYPYLAMLDDAIRSGSMRHPATRTVIRNNHSTTPVVIAKNFSDSPSRDFVWHPIEKWTYHPSCWVEENNSAGAPPDGFAPLPPLSSIGVQNTPERASWPIVHPVTIKCGRLELKRRR